MSSSPGIARPRPVSLLNRQSRRSLGAVPETLQKSLTAAARRMSTTSMPATLPTDTEEPAASDSLHHHHHHHHQQQQQHTAPLGDAWPNECEQGSSPERKEGGSNPEPTASPPSSVPTTPLSPPLSPVFSAVSSEPLKPQPLASLNSCKQPYKGGPAPTHTTTTNPSLSGPNYFGDKYAALADLDSALHNPNHTPTPTTIDWCPSPSAKDEEPDHPHHTTIITTPTTKNKNPTPSHPTPLQRSPSEPYAITGDKYAALVNLNSTSGLTTVVDWDQTIEFKTEHASELEGPSGSACRPGAALHANYSEKPQGNCADDRGSRKMAESVRVGGNTTTLISSSPQRRSMISSSSSPAAGAQTQMYGSPPQSSIMYAAQATVNGLQRPTTLFNAPFTTTTTPHPGFVHPAPVSPSAAGYIFRQQAAQHGRQVTSPVGGSWVPAYAAGAVGSQGFPVPQGAGWGQVGGFLPSPPSSHPSHPFVTGAQFPGQASMCLS